MKGHTQEELLEIIEVGISKLKTADQKESILVMGGTNEGKSTLINYLLGSKIQQVNNEFTNISYMDTLGPGYTSIGHEVASHTLYPQAFEFGPKIYREKNFSEYTLYLNQWSVSANVGEILFIYHPTDKKWQVGLITFCEVMHVKAKPRVEEISPGCLYLYRINKQYVCLFYSTSQKKIIEIALEGSNSVVNTIQGLLNKITDVTELNSNYILKKNLIQFTNYYYYNPLKSYQLMNLENSDLVDVLNTIGSKKITTQHKIALIQLFSKLTLVIRRSEITNEDVEKVTTNNWIVVIKKLANVEKIKFRKDITPKDTDSAEVKNQLAAGYVIIGNMLGTNNFCYIKKNHKNNPSFRYEVLDKIYEDQFATLLNERQPELELAKESYVELLEHIMTQYIYANQNLPIQYYINFRKNGLCESVALDPDRNKLDQKIMNELSNEKVNEEIPLNYSQPLFAPIQEKLLSMQGSHYPLLPFKSELYQFYIHSEDTNQYSYIDLPGIGENRGEASQLWASMSLEWVARSASEIKSVFYVVSYETLNNKDKGIEKTITNLQQRFKEEKKTLKIMEPLCTVRTIERDMTKEQTSKLVTKNDVVLIKRAQSYLVAFKDKFDRYKELDLQATDKLDQIKFDSETPFIPSEGMKMLFDTIKKNNGIINENIYRVEHNGTEYVLNYYSDWESDFMPNKKPTRIHVNGTLNIAASIKYMLFDKNKYRDIEDLMVSELQIKTDVVTNNYLYIIHISEISHHLLFKVGDNWDQIKVRRDDVHNNKYLQNFLALRTKIINKNGSLPSFTIHPDSLNAINSAISNHLTQLYYRQMQSIHFFITKAITHASFANVSTLNDIYLAVYKRCSEWVDLQNANLNNTQGSFEKDMITNQVSFLQQLVLYPCHLFPIMEKEISDSIKDKMKRDHGVLLISKSNNTYALGFWNDEDKYYESLIPDNNMTKTFHKVNFSKFEPYFSDVSLLDQINKVLIHLHSSIRLRRPFTILDVTDDSQRKELLPIIKSSSSLKLSLFNFSSNNQHKRQRFLEAIYEKLGGIHTQLSLLMNLRGLHRIDMQSKRVPRLTYQDLIKTWNSIFDQNQNAIFNEKKKDYLNIVFDEEYIKTWYSFFSWNIAKRIKAWWTGFYNFSYQGPPFTEISPEIVGGTLTEKLVNPEDGIYEANYHTDVTRTYHSARVILLTIPQNLPQNREYLRSLEILHTYLLYLPYHLVVTPINISLAYIDVKNNSMLDPNQLNLVRNWQKILLVHDKSKCRIVFLGGDGRMCAEQMQLEGEYCYIILVEGDVTAEQKQSVCSKNIVVLRKKDQNYFLGYATSNLANSEGYHELVVYKEIQITESVLLEKISKIRFSNRDYIEEDLDNIFSALIIKNNGISHINTFKGLFLKEFRQLNPKEFPFDTLNIYGRHNHGFRVSFNNLLKHLNAWSLHLQYQHLNEKAQNVSMEPLSQFLDTIKPDFSNLYLAQCLLPYIRNLDDISDLTESTQRLMKNDYIESIWTQKPTFTHFATTPSKEQKKSEGRNSESREEKVNKSISSSTESLAFYLNH